MLYKVGKTVFFGSYGGEDIEWQVLEVRDDGSCVLMSVYGLEVKVYNEDAMDVTRETCTLRAWLNGEFYTAASSAEERARIVTVTNRNTDNPSYGTAGGNDTEDKVWLLSLDDVCRYYEGISPKKSSWDCGCSEQLIAKPTETAIAHGAYTLLQEEVGTHQSGAGRWWLRSLGSDSCYAALVIGNGDVKTSGSKVSSDYGMIRPVVVVAPGLFN